MFSPFNPKMEILGVGASFSTVLVSTVVIGKQSNLTLVKKFPNLTNLNSDGARVLIHNIYSPPEVLNKILYKHTACSKKTKTN